MRCQSCGHDEVEHEGLVCDYEDVVNGPCDCRGFEAPAPVHNGYGSRESAAQWAQALSVTASRILEEFGEDAAVQCFIAAGEPMHVAEGQPS